MPRKAPEKVIEHRISLSNFERDLLTRTIKTNEENRLYVAGINQIGGIVGSSVVLYGLMAYFGYSLLDTAYEKAKDFIDNASTSLADTAGGIFGIKYTTEEAEAIKNAFDRIDEAIVYERNESRLNDVVGQGLIAQLRNGEIDYATFRTEMYAVTTRTDELEALTNDIAFARAQVKAYQMLKNTGSINELPAWLAIDDWRALLIASYDGQYAPLGNKKERPDVTY